jgi:hypothetical protein
VDPSIVQPGPICNHVIVTKLQYDLHIGLPNNLYSDTQQVLHNEKQNGLHKVLHNDLHKNLHNGMNEDSHRE